MIPSSNTPIEYDVFLATLREEKKFSTFEKLAEDYGVNRYYLWHMLNTKSYRPPSWVCHKLNIKYYIEVPPCPIHGKACTLDCANEKAVPLAAVVRERKSKPDPRRRPTLGLNNPERDAILVLSKMPSADYLERFIELLDMKEK